LLNAKTPILENFESTLKSNEYLDFNFEYKKTGLYFKEDGKGTLLFKNNGDFVLEITFEKNSKYTIKFENEMFFELITQGSKNSFNVYKEPSQLQIAFIVDFLKKAPTGASAMLGALEKNYQVKSALNKISLKSKIQDAILQSAEIEQQENQTLISIVFRPDIESNRTESIEIVAQRNEKSSLAAALRFILNVPKNAAVALVED
jgi:hypothetical protein